jgi:hypothetical protein
MPGFGLGEVLYGLLTLLVLLIGAYARSLEKKIEALESFKDEVLRHRELDAKTYLSKSEFSDFAKELKDALIRIENKIEKLRE